MALRYLRDKAPACFAYMFFAIVALSGNGSSASTTRPTVARPGINQTNAACVAPLRTIEHGIDKPRALAFNSLGDLFGGQHSREHGNGVRAEASTKPRLTLFEAISTIRSPWRSTVPAISTSQIGTTTV